MARIGLYFKNIVPPMVIDFDASSNKNSQAIRYIEMNAGHENAGRQTIVDNGRAKHLIVVAELRMVVEIPE